MASALPSDWIRGGYMFSLQRFADEAATDERRKRESYGRSADWKPADYRADARRELARGTLAPKHWSPHLGEMQVKQLALAKEFLKLEPSKTFVKIRFLDTSVVMLEHPDGSIYRVHLCLDGAYAIQKDGIHIHLKHKLWESGMCPYKWLMLHVA